MADQTPETGNETTEQPVQPIVINAQYTKDLSFEAPTAPGIFGIMQQNQPDIAINVNVGVNPFEDNVFEVILETSVRCTVGDDVGFVLELEYAGLFTVNVDEENQGPMLLIECPRLLFPFARNIISEVTRDGGFPPLMLGPVDFVAMYKQRLEEYQQQEENTGTENA